MEMPKHTRKRKQTEDVEYEIEAPKAKLRPYDEAEDEYLSHILFGGSSTFLQCLEEVEKEPGPSNADMDSGLGDDGSGEDGDHQERKAAWYDENDDGIDVGQALNSQKRRLPNGGVNNRKHKYANLLQNKFQSIVGTPKWAELKQRKTSESDSDDEILRTCGFVNKWENVSLPGNVLEFKKVKDLNNATYSEGPFINAIEFHPTSSVALVAGNKGIATIFAVDGKRNDKLHSTAFERFPIVCAKFIHNGNHAIFGSRKNYIYNYDLLATKATRYNLPPGLTQFKNFVASPDSKFIAAAGKWGEVHVLSATSKERISTLKQDSEVTALEFNSNSKLLFGHSDTGEITIWDINMMRVKHKFVDEGCLQGTAISLSVSNQFLAAGSGQGVVNLYGMEDVLQNKLPKPRKTILNLTTGITELKFNQSSEMLAMCSNVIPNSVKLFHIGSGTVFSNFPVHNSKIGNINTLNFSPGGGYVAFGNQKSVVSLYRLKHYKNY